MPVQAKYKHTNINARDWRKLSQFYKTVFDCRPVPPERSLQGEWIEKVTNINGVHIEGIHLALPGYGENGPTLEIFTYNKPQEGDSKAVNAYGFAHIAFEVEDVDQAYRLLLKEGGSAVGEMQTRHYPQVGTLTVIYAKDPEGNIVELQKWS